MRDLATCRAPRKSGTMITPTRNAALAVSMIPLALLVGCGSPEVESGDQKSATTVDGSSASSSPSPSPDVAPVCETASLSDPCIFGQTAIYSDTVGGEEMRLEITVLDPVAFTPTTAAVYFDNLATEQPALPVNVYFPVTIKNVSPALDRDSSFVFSQATNEAEGEYDT